MKIILIGYMGSGKSSVGKLLAERLKVPFKDLDQEIQLTNNMSISKIFSKKGEIYFRKSENEILKELLLQQNKFVLATGGGTPCYADSLSAMLNASNTVTIYLKTSLQILCDRLIIEKQKRPLISHLNTKEEMMEFVGIHLFERSNFYNQANLVIDTGANSSEKIVDIIVEKLF